ncbi:flavodoxin domain-containing protein [Corynebacterium aquatimens]|uniref:Menaquinone-dependent protoporphyrinogen IX oxidase n=1 Tax=Corynebacterium aquatimens TaxID=1190508 RepID=A0A931GUG3_9CORY|nr:flavodoxin domain-containing protein [Corynebacterium aquatimens]MBG6122745.1 menaquinone-dependent protoporphyrinogen IX oxidase [Corynebacterium aquatimens]WJY66918.1 Flavodoxin domain protein [Corynebacterium aquatimens]
MQPQTTSIFYTSYYGSTQRYAEALAEQIGVTAVELPDPATVTADGGPIVILSPIHGPSHPGARFVKELGEEVVDKRKLCLATVGMTLDEVAVEQDAARDLLGKRADRVARFYLPGRLNYPELTPSHRNVMRAMVTMLKLKPGKTANERMMIDSYGKDVDRVDLGRLDEIVEWLAESDG